MTKSQKVFSAVAVLVILTSAASALPAYASNGSGGSTNFFQGLVQFIAQKFGLDQTQVQSAVKDYQTQQQQKRQQTMQDNNKKRLDSLVSQGKITASQEQQIIDEQNKLKSEYNPADFKSLTADQRKSKFQQEQTEIQTWSKDTGIDAKYLGIGFGNFGRVRMFNHWNK